MATTTAVSSQQSLADLVWGFFRPAAVRPVGVGLGIFPAGGAAVRPVGVGLGIFPAGGGPAGRRWLGDFPDIRAVSAGSSGSSSAAHLYRTFFYRVPVVPHIFAGRAGFPVWRRWTRHPGADVGFFTIGKIDKNQIRERLGHFLAIFSKIQKLKKDSCFHVFFAAMPGDTAHFSIGFQLYRTFFYRISVVPHIFL